MKSCIIITFPHALGVPGGGTHDCLQTALHLQVAGADVIVVAVASHTISRYPRSEPPPEQRGNAAISELEAKGIEVIYVKQNRFHYLLDGLAVRRAVAEIIRSRKVDAVFGWHQEVAFLSPLLRANGILFGMIATNGNYAAWYDAARGVRKVIQNFAVVRQLQSADIVFARSNFMKNLISELFSLDVHRIHVVYCGIEPIFGHMERVFSTELTRFLFFGWFIPEKGLFDVLEALGKVTARGHVNWTLRIAGWGDEKKVRQVAGEHGVADHIVMLGKLDRPELINELGEAQLAILPSYAESFGLAVAEAQLAGLPVIAYEVGGVPEVVEKGVTGWLTPMADKNLLADAIIAAVSQPKETYEMGLAGRGRVSKCFNWQHTGELMLDCLQKVKMNDNDRVGCRGAVMRANA